MFSAFPFLLLQDCTPICIMGGDLSVRPLEEGADYPGEVPCIIPASRIAIQSIDHLEGHCILLIEMDRDGVHGREGGLHDYRPFGKEIPRYHH